VKYASLTTIDDRASGSDYTGGFAYEGFGMRYLDILRGESYLQSTSIAIAHLCSIDFPRIAICCGVNFVGSSNPIF
jgi:hypothetical protein